MQISGFLATLDEFKDWVCIPECEQTYGVGGSTPFRQVVSSPVPLGSHAAPLMHVFVVRTLQVFI